MDSQDPVALAAVHAIRTGDTASLATLLGEHPGLACQQIHGTRTPLHVAADWPGYFPAGPAIVRLLIEAGADPNADTRVVIQQIVELNALTGPVVFAGERLYVPRG